MNAQELKALCKKSEAETHGTWSEKANALTNALTTSKVYFEEIGADADWRVNVVLDENRSATVRYSGGLKVSLQ